MSRALLLHQELLMALLERHLHRRPCSLLAPVAGDVHAEEPDYTGGGFLWFLRRLIGLLAVDEELLLRAVCGVGEDDGVAGSEALLPDEAAPALGEHVALAAVPVRVPEPPHLALAVLKIEEHALAGGLLLRRALQREVLLRVLLGHDEEAELADVARRHDLLEEQLPSPQRRRLRARAHATAAAQALTQLGGVGVLTKSLR